MLQELDGHLTDHEVRMIVCRVLDQYKRFKQLTGSLEYSSIFSDEYAPHNKKFGISWAIASAFPSGSKIEDRIVVKRIEYGKKHVRPALLSNNILIYILNDTTEYDSDYLKNCYALNVNHFSEDRLFCYIKLYINHKNISKISLCLPDENGMVIGEETLLDANQLKMVAA